jgi:hypothetical protein
MIIRKELEAVSTSQSDCHNVLAAKVESFTAGTIVLFSKLIKIKD